jgi:transposase
MNLTFISVRRDRVRLSEWAERNGVHYQTAWVWAKEGRMPVPSSRHRRVVGWSPSPNPSPSRWRRACWSLYAMRKLQRRIADGRARILSATVRAEAGRWFASFTVEVQRAEPAPARRGAVVGVDLGVKTLAVFSDGRSAADNPRHCEAARRKLARLSRAVSRERGPDRRIGAQPSNRWRKASAARNRVHHRVVNLPLRSISLRWPSVSSPGAARRQKTDVGADRRTRPGRAGGCEASTPHRAVPAQVRRESSARNGRITEIH